VSIYPHRDWRRFAARVLTPFYNPLQTIHALMGVPRFIRNYRAYRNLSAEAMPLEEWYPCFTDRGEANSVSPYMLESVWATRGILARCPPFHVDIGSQTFFVMMLATMVKTVFVDVRPCSHALMGVGFTQGSLTALPFAANSVPSLSCLSVAEHIGLGRYDDALDPKGTEHAARELARVLTPGGALYFSVPTGYPRVQFNAHRIQSPQQVVEMFDGLHLLDFAAVDTNGQLKSAMQPGDSAALEMPSSMFLFSKK
jgi:SAM-dependent methyltransferase